VKVGIVGLPSVGKSTLFQLLTGTAPPLPGSRPEVRLGVARVPDPRIEALTELFQPKKKTLASVEYVDVPGVSKGSALVDLPALRGTDALIHVVRAFESDVVPHPEGSVDPARDVEVLELELMLADLAIVQRRIEKLDQLIKKMRLPEDRSERELFGRLEEALEAEQPLRALGLSPEEHDRLRGYGLLSRKPLLLVANLGEDAVRDAPAALETAGLTAFTRRPGMALVAVSAPIEAEMTELDEEEARVFREDLGLDEPGLDRVIRVSYELLGLISFMTVGEDECRAWTVARGTRARQAGGAIHSDIERGFIRAEVVRAEELLAAGSLAACREQATLRLEGKDYVVQDGDIVHFRFNV
jgi:GTP-binding protein YchF